MQRKRPPARILKPSPPALSLPQGKERVVTITRKVEMTREVMTTREAETIRRVAPAAKDAVPEAAIPAEQKAGPASSVVAQVQVTVYTASVDVEAAILVIIGVGSVATTVGAITAGLVLVPAVIGDPAHAAHNRVLAFT